jgi:hypothetical protein
VSSPASITTNLVPLSSAMNLRLATGKSTSI